MPTDTIHVFVQCRFIYVENISYYCRVSVITKIAI